MVKIVEGEEYLSAGEAAQVLGISLPRFYTNARKYLRVYRFDAKKVKWYNKKQVLAMKVKAMGNVEAIASETAAAIVHHITGKPADQNAIAQAIATIKA